MKKMVQILERCHFFRLLFILVLKKLGKMSKNEIIDFMHKEQAYLKTAPKDVISFRYAESLQI